MTELKRKKRNLFFLQCGGFLISVAPLLSLVTVRAERYVSTPSDGIRLGLGGGISLILVFLRSIGKLNIPRRLFGTGLVCLLAYLLNAVLVDIMLLSAAAFAGDLGELLLFSLPVRNAKEKLSLCKTATATTQAVENMLKNYSGRC